MWWHPRSGRRAVTLIEVLVASTIAVAALGLLYGLLTETRGACLRGQNRLAMQAQARLVADEIASFLEAGVRPGYLDGPTSGTPAPVFTADRCGLLTMAGGDGPLPRYLLLTTEPAGAATPGRVLCAAPPGAARALGLAAPGFSTGVAFSYATQASGTGDGDLFSKDLPPGAFPRMIRIAVRVTAEGKAPAAPSPVEHFDTIALY